jgi:hypothetical protein
MISPRSTFSVFFPFLFALAHLAIFGIWTKGKRNCQSRKGVIDSNWRLTGWKRMDGAGPRNTFHLVCYTSLILSSAIDR